MLAEDVINAVEGNLDVSPSIFLAFGSPLQAIDFDEYNESLCDYLETIPYPRSILVVSPFWKTENVRITNSIYPDIVYDFEGGPETLKLLTYPCSGNPDLANTIKNLLESRSIKAELDDDRGLDKGAWVPLYVAFPDMDIPVVQMSLPKNATPKELFKIGNTLIDLRKTGTMILVVGNTVHESFVFEKEEKVKPTSKWAKELDSWIFDNLKSHNYDDLLKVESKAPHPNKIDFNRLSPLFFMMGTLSKKDIIQDIFDSFYYGNTSMRSFAFSRKN